jgi:DNA repair protein RecN (Recombination protein N)
LLSHLNIQGLAIIDSLEIDFSRGFNVITGETGAGKSILIKALGLLLGAKSNGDVVRKGRESASITGCFEIPKGHRCVEVLNSFEIPYDTKSPRFEVIVRRTVNVKGRSQSWINDIPVTVGLLKDFAEALIDVFGQHENLRILEAVHHTSYIDQFLPDRSVLEKYRQHYNSCMTKFQEITDLVEDFMSKSKDADYLAFRIEEINKFEPSREDYDTTLGVCQSSGNVTVLAEQMEKAVAIIDQGSDGEPISRMLWEVAKAIRSLESFDPKFAEMAKQASDLASGVEDLSYQLGKKQSAIDFDPTEIANSEERLAGYQSLFRKFASHDIDGLMNEIERLSQEIKFLDSASVSISERLRVLAKETKSLKTLADALTKGRHAARIKAKSKIEKEMHELAMPGASIDIEFQPIARAIPAADFKLFGEDCVDLWETCADHMSSNGETGAEKAQFLLASNKGEAMLPLQKIASGGEISRIMLALKKSLSAGADTCILVFDEIDSGISGRVADIVGKKMREISESFQVICISHLPQVAAYADTHFLVHKFDRNKRTESTISQLSKTDSEKEIARLLSGDEISDSSLANARNLMKKARAVEKPN